MKLRYIFVMFAAMMLMDSSAQKITLGSCVMKDGSIVQSGRHESLVATPGLYRDLWHAGEEVAA